MVTMQDPKTFMRAKRTLAIALPAILIGCGGGDDDAMTTYVPPPEVDAATVPDGMTPMDTMTPTPDVAVSDTTASDAAAPDTAVTDTGPEPPRPELIPTTRDALYAWLKAGNYKSWSHESAPHASAGPHGAPVLVYVNDALMDSLAAGSAQHPAGAAAVKELLSGGAVDGWAVSVKVEPSSDGGMGWYWFEIYSSTNPADALAGRGLGGCTSCHVAGKDYVRTTYPLK